MGMAKSQMTRDGTAGFIKYSTFIGLLEEEVAKSRIPDELPHLKIYFFRNFVSSIFSSFKNALKIWKPAKKWKNKFSILERLTRKNSEK